MTKKEMFNLIATVNADNEEIVTFCKHELDLLEAKSKASKKPTPKQQENEILIDVIRGVLAGYDEPISFRELKKQDEKLDCLSDQKVASLLGKLVSAKEVEKTYNKKTPVYLLVA